MGPKSASRSERSGVPDLLRMMKPLALQEPDLPFDERVVAQTWTTNAT
jgi:hypothetical protein